MLAELFPGVLSSLLRLQILAQSSRVWYPAEFYTYATYARCLNYVSNLISYNYPIFDMGILFY